MKWRSVANMYVCVFVPNSVVIFIMTRQWGIHVLLGIVN